MRTRAYKATQCCRPQKNLERTAAWRAVCPDITIRSTFIAGFPGDTELPSTRSTSCEVKA